jgi:chromosomal replication initiator protein
MACIRWVLPNPTPPYKKSGLKVTLSAARRVAEADKVTFNPLFLYGGVGLGKTHLMHAIAWHICKSYPQRRVIYLSAEKFMYLL